MEKILLDTDIGGDIDDAVCLAYLLKEPQCALLGITTVSWESEKRAAVADAVCRSAKKDVPIVAGMDLPMQPVSVHPTPEGAAALAHWPHRIYQKADAPAFLYQKIKENPHEVTLIGIGPMTNIASLFCRYPDSVGLLKGLFVMNGYFGAAPLPEPWYNWNAWLDPLASQIVFAAPVPVHRVFPLDVTETLTTEADGFSTIWEGNSSLKMAVADFGGTWLQNTKKLTLHDPLAAVSVFHPEICRFQKGTVLVETEKRSDPGRTAFTADPKGNAEIAVAADRESFYSILFHTLGEEKQGTASYLV